MRRLRSALLLAAFFISSAGVASAQSKTLLWENYDVILNVLSNGDLQVVERQKITFTSGTFTYGYAVIPTDRTEGIDSVGISEPGGRQYLESDTHLPYTFSVSRTSQEIEIEWYFPPAADETRMFDLTYIAHGAIRVYETGDKLQWIAIDNQRDFPIRAASVTVNLPASASLTAIESLGVSAPWQVNAARTGVTFVAERQMSPRDTFEVGVEFTHGVIPSRQPKWQPGFDLNIGTWLNLGLGFLTVVLFFGGPLLAYAAWFSAGRDPETGALPEYLTQPPETVPPGVLGTLIDERADMRDIVATLVDLARREYMTIEEVKREVLVIFKADDFLFRKLEGDERQLRPYEAEILRGVFPDSKSERKLSDLRNKFYTHLPAIQEKLYAEMVSRGYFKKSPEKVRQMWRSIGIAVVVVAAVLGSAIAPRFPDFSLLLTFVFIGLGASGVALVIAGQFMPAKTRKGAEAAGRWLAFKKYLERIETLTDLTQAGELFERHLAFAIAFGINTSWIHKFSGLASTPQPLWYVPYGGRGSSSGGAMSKSLAPTGGGMTGVEGLQGMSSSMAGGLQSMSDGLTRMLNSAGTVMRSSPSSSGGGGFSSGGGGGGGGRGFG